MCRIKTILWHLQHWILFFSTSVISKYKYVQLLKICIWAAPDQNITIILLRPKTFVQRDPQYIQRANEARYLVALLLRACWFYSRFSVHLNESFRPKPNYRQCFHRSYSYGRQKERQLKAFSHLHEQDFTRWDGERSLLLKTLTANPENDFG